MFSYFTQPICYISTHSSWLICTNPLLQILHYNFLTFSNHSLPINHWLLGVCQLYQLKSLQCIKIMFHSSQSVFTSQDSPTLKLLSIPHFINSEANSVLFYWLSLISIIVILDTMKYHKDQGENEKLWTQHKLVCLHKTEEKSFLRTELAKSQILYIGNDNTVWH